MPGMGRQFTICEGPTAIVLLVLLLAEFGRGPRYPAASRVSAGSSRISSSASGRKAASVIRPTRLGPSSAASSTSADGAAGERARAAEAGTFGVRDDLATRLALREAPLRRAAWLRPRQDRCGRGSVGRGRADPWRGRLARRSRPRSPPRRRRTREQRGNLMVEIEGHPLTLHVPMVPLGTARSVARWLGSALGASSLFVQRTDRPDKIETPADAGVPSFGRLSLGGVGGARSGASTQTVPTHRAASVGAAGRTQQLATVSQRLDFQRPDGADE